MEKSGENEDIVVEMTSLRVLRAAFNPLSVISTVNIR